MQCDVIGYKNFASCAALC